MKIAPEGGSLWQISRVLRDVLPCRAPPSAGRGPRQRPRKWRPVCKPEPESDSCLTSSATRATDITLPLSNHGCSFSCLGKLVPSCTDRFALNNIGRLAKSRSPLQLVHGTADNVVALSHAKHLHARCRTYHPLMPAWIDGAKHNGLVTEFAEEHKVELANGA